MSYVERWLRATGSLMLRVIACCVLALGGLSNARSSEEVLKIDRQVSVTSHRVTPRLIVRTHGGGYIVAGSNESDTAAWATLVTSSGRPVWEYLDGGSNGWINIPKSMGHFVGAAVIGDNSILLCGATREGAANVSLLVRLAPDGSLLDRRPMSPHEDKGYFSFFNSCVPWGSGAIVFGTAIRRSDSTVGADAAGWLVKLSDRGGIEWEKFEDELTGTNDAFELADGGLLLSVRAPRAELVKLDREGRVLARKAMPGEPMLVRPLYQSSWIRAIAASPGAKTFSFYTLDSDLREIAHSESPRFYLSRAYELPDRSLVMFGGRPTSGEPRAAVIRRLADNSIFAELIGPARESDVIADAAPVPDSSQPEFVMVRRVTHPIPGSPEAQGHGAVSSRVSVLDWLRISPPP